LPAHRYYVYGLNQEFIQIVTKIKTLCKEYSKSLHRLPKVVLKKKNNKKNKNKTKKKKGGVKMIIKFIRKKVEEAKRKKYLIRSAIERKKTNFVFRYLLLNYEKQTEGQVDIPAFMYAEADMRKIKKMNKLNEAYDFAKEVLKKNLETEKKTADIDLEIKEQMQYDADWAELQAERDEAMLWGV
jgi:hypothetical protein